MMNACVELIPTFVAMVILVASDPGSLPDRRVFFLAYKEALV